MPYKLIAPGKRKGNRVYIIRGTVDGQRFELSAQTTDKAKAERDAPSLVASALAAGADEQRDIDPSVLTFEQACRLYIARGVSGREERRLEKLYPVLGARRQKDIVEADIVAAANALYPKDTNQTRNRNVVTPVSSVLHYAAKNKWRDWLRIARFKEPKPKTRAASRDVRKILLANTTGKRRLLILWLFGQGTRITDTVRVEWPHLSLQAGTVELWVAKTREWRTLPLDDALLAALANEDKGKPLWPWKTRDGVYKWLQPLCKRLGIAFTPHMARHSVGAWLNESGAGLRTIMDALGHESPVSSMRYQSAGVEVVREAKRKMAKLK